MFERIFVEYDIADNPSTQALLERLPGNAPVQRIDKLENYFGRVKKPYLQKRNSLNLFIGTKKGHLIKPAPPAYGVISDPHFYFIHSYNCIYECEYCYLQGYFHSPDLVFYVNYEEIAAAMEETIHHAPAETFPWFHAGEFSDSLALSHLTQELGYYWKVMEKNPRARLELRTKSANIREVLKLPPLPQIFVSFSLAPQSRIVRTEHKTASLGARLAAMKKLAENGYSLGVHLDPIIYEENVIELYSECIDEIFDHVSPQQISYLSMGVVRFTKDGYYQVEKNYPQSDLHRTQFAKSFDDKVRYTRPMRLHILNKIKDYLLKKGMNDSKIYFCME